MAMTRMVDGEVVPLTSREEADLVAERQRVAAAKAAREERPLSEKLQEKIDRDPMLKALLEHLNVTADDLALIYTE
jgi:hypothetical protein